MMDMTTTSLATMWTEQVPYKTALEALERFHWSVFPLGRDKRPPETGGTHSDGTPKCLAWKQYQTRRATPKEVLSWQKRFQPSAYAVITGRISGILILDFDGDLGKGTLDALGLLPHVQTGSGGSHVYFHHPGWYVPTLTSKSKRELGQRWPGLDIRADGGYGAFCGRNAHGPYIWLRDPVPEEVYLLPETLRDVLGLLHAPEGAGVQASCHEPNEKTAQDAVQCRVPRDSKGFSERLIDRALSMIGPAMGRNDAGFWLACQLRDHGCSRAEGEQVLLEYAHQVPSLNSKGQRDAYTEEEALASVASAYSKSARGGWRSLTASHPLANGSNGAGTPDGASNDLPEVIVGSDQLRDVTNQAVEALMRVEVQTPTLFLQSARLVRVGHNEMKRPIVTQMGVAEVKEVLTHSANYYRLRKGGADDDYEKIPVSPPREIAEQILARQAQKPYLPFPPLEAIVEIPVIRPDGTLLDQPGYDAPTRLYYAPRAGVEACKVSLDPSRKEREAALALLLEAIGEFPYVDEADLANGLALLLTPFLRPAIKRHVPLALLDAPKPGTGKGLFSDVLAIIATGTSSAILTMSESEEELQKSITSLLIEGTTIITIDNITGRLQSKHLEAVLTADWWRGRVLGQSKMVLVPQRATWLATGNNIKLGGDLLRRCYRIRLDPHVSKPWMRSGFTHEDLAGWVMEQRGALISALLTLSRAWYAAGQPLITGLPAMGTFTNWVKTIGSILAYAGIHGFLANQEKLYEEVDEESAQWEAFLQAWLDLFGTQWVKIADIIAMMNGADGEELAGSDLPLPAHVLFETLPEALQMPLREKSSTFKIRLGKALEKRVDTCFGDANLRLERGKDEHSKVSLWRVVAGSAGSSSFATRVKKSSLALVNEERPTGESDWTDSPHSPQPSIDHIVQNGSTSGPKSLSSDTGNEPLAERVNELPADGGNEREEFEL
jgi:hypothetical protein